MVTADPPRGLNATRNPAIRTNLSLEERPVLPTVLIAATLSGVPQLNVDRICRGPAAHRLADEEYKTCLDSEKNARDSQTQDNGRGHRSAEPGHTIALEYLGLRPLVDLGLRLGEGTGALLALPLVQSAARALRDVATFDSAGVSDKI